MHGSQIDIIFYILTWICTDHHPFLLDQREGWLEMSHRSTADTAWEKML